MKAARWKTAKRICGRILLLLPAVMLIHTAAATLQMLLSPDPYTSFPWYTPLVLIPLLIYAIPVSVFAILFLILVLLCKRKDKSFE